MQPVIDIPTHKSGLLRTNHKFCFPCDNSVIRVDKRNVAGRRFGSSVIIKDNMVFGIKENEGTVKEKVAGDDDLLNQEARRASDRNCEFWLEFENKARLHISMLEPVEAQAQLIPPQTNEDTKSTKKKADFSTVLDSIENPDDAMTMSRNIEGDPSSPSKM